MWSKAKLVKGAWLAKYCQLRGTIPDMLVMAKIFRIEKLTILSQNLAGIRNIQNLLTCESTDKAICYSAWGVK